MNIKTKEFNVSEAEFQHLIRILYYKSRRTLLIGFAIFAIIIIVVAILEPLFSFLAIYFVIALGWLLAVPFITNTAKSQAKINFQSRICEITDNYFSMSYADGSLLKLHFNNFIKVTRESEYYFLYMAKINFHYLPFRAFNSEDDINEFEAALKNKKLIN